MKKWLIAATLAGVSASAFAQGTIDFSTAVINPSVFTNDLKGHSGLAKDGSFTVALYWAAGAGTGVINPATTTPILTGAGSGQGDGQFTVGVATTGAGTPPSGTGEFEVVGWSGNFANYNAAVAANAFTGIGNPFQNATGGSTGGGTHPADPQTEMTGWTGNLILSPSVPEPTTIALGGLGAAALLLFRRRK